jgi:hypothetical protein
MADVAAILSPDQFPALAGAAPSRAGFPAFRPLPLQLDLTAFIGRLDLGAGLVANGVKAVVKADRAGFEVAPLTANLARGEIEVQARLRRDGERFAVNGRMSGRGLDLGMILPRGLVHGRADTAFEFAGIGDSEADLVSGLGGGGETVIRELAVAKFDPLGLRRAIQKVDPDAEAPKAGQFETIALQELSAGPLSLPRLTVPMVGAAGNLRIGPIVATLEGVTLQATLATTLGTGSRSGRASVTATGEIANWRGAPPQIGIDFAGTLAEPRRSLDVAAVVNAMTVRAVQREIARVEAIEADQRERSYHARVVRAFREADQREEELRIFLENEELENARLARLRAATLAFNRAHEADRLALAIAAIDPNFADPEGLANEFEQVQATRPDTARRVFTIPLPPPAPAERRIRAERPERSERPERRPASLPLVVVPPSGDARNDVDRLPTGTSQRIIVPPQR